VRWSVSAVENSAVVSTCGGRHVRWSVRAVVSTYGGQYVRCSVRAAENSGGQYVRLTVRAVENSAAVSKCGGQ
jgi:hypothetical protein